MSKPRAFANRHRFAIGLLSIAAFVLTTAFWAGLPSSHSSTVHAAPPEGKGGGKGGGGGGGDGDATSLAYKFIPLGVHSANDINDDGVIVGMDNPGDLQLPYVLIPKDADNDGFPDTWFLDDDGDGENDLVTLLPAGSTLGGRASSLNHFGEIVGSSDWTAALWKDGAYIDLGAPGPRFISDASSINDRGVVVGDTESFLEEPVRPFLINPLDTNGDGEPDTWFQDNDGDGGNDLMVKLLDADTTTAIRATHINNRGWVLVRGALRGLIIPADADGDGIPDTWFIDDGQGGNLLFVEIPPDKGRINVLWHSNVNGDVVGGSGNQAAIWEIDSSGNILSSSLLPNPKGKVDGTGARAIDETGQLVVGYAQVSDGRRACVWQNGQRGVLLRDLATNPEAVDDIAATDVNRSGEIIGATVRATATDPGAYIAVPTTAP
jgi:uncharacterized membrane protein